MTSKAFADLLLNKAGIAVLPGTDFGAHGEGKIRLSYVSDMQVLQEGMKRIARAVEGLQ
jgi:aspartate/methionine/tyrosine aminotransferase